MNKQEIIKEISKLQDEYLNISYKIHKNEFNPFFDKSYHWGILEEIQEKIDYLEDLLRCKNSTKDV